MSEIDNNQFPRKHIEETGSMVSNDYTKPINYDNTDLHVMISGLTDTGRKRHHNEDGIEHILAKNGLALFVCDGMGGHVGGAIASSTAIDAIINFFRDKEIIDPFREVKEAIISANKAILDKVKENPSLSGMGSTCVLVLIFGGQVFVAHVGDSRVYLIRKDKHQSIQLTKDQSFVQSLVDSGQITEEEAERHPRSNEITNALGLPEMTEPVVRREGISPDAGDCFLLCSDGLTKVLTKDEIYDIVLDKTIDIKSRARHLIDAANKKGGPDNVSVILAEFALKPQSTYTKSELSKENKKKTNTKTKSLGLWGTVAIVLFAIVAIFAICVLIHGTRDKDGEVVTDIESVASPNTDLNVDETIKSSAEGLDAFMTDNDLSKDESVSDSKDSSISTKNQVDLDAKQIVIDNADVISVEATSEVEEHNERDEERSSRVITAEVSSNNTIEITWDPNSEIELKLPRKDDCKNYGINHKFSKPDYSDVHLKHDKKMINNQYIFRLKDLHLTEDITVIISFGDELKYKVTIIGNPKSSDEIY